MADRTYTLRELVDSGLRATRTVDISVGAAAPTPSIATLREAVGHATRGDLVLSDFTSLVAAATTWASPADAAAWFINTKYSQLGGNGGFLGAAQTGINVCPDGVGYYRHFAGGSIYYHPHTGAHEVHGDIRAKWAGMGWERSPLGYPVTDERDGAHPSARFSRFQGGAIYWHPNSGSREVHGAIYRRYQQLGGDAGFLGCPLTDETATPDQAGRFNHFEGGSIYWKPSLSAHEVHGLIRQRWADSGWERNAALGYPISDEIAPPAATAASATTTTPGRPHIDVPAVLVDVPAVRPTGPVVRPETPLLHVHLPDARVDSAGTGPVVVRPTLERPDAPLHIDPDLLDRLRGNLPPAITPSPHRYSDFENGVVYWSSGASQASILSPSNITVDGIHLCRSAPEVLQAAQAVWTAAVSLVPQAQLHGPATFAGVTDYSFDGLSVHNRRYRVLLDLQIGPTISVPLLGDQPTHLTVEVELEVAYDPLRRAVVGFLTRWSLRSGQGPLAGQAAASLHGALDPRLWAVQTLWPVPLKNGDRVLNVLSVKVQPNGRTDVYLEPASITIRPGVLDSDIHVVGGIGNITPSGPIGTPPVVGPSIPHPIPR